MALQNQQMAQQMALQNQQMAQRNQQMAQQMAQQDEILQQVLEKIGKIEEMLQYQGAPTRRNGSNLTSECLMAFKCRWIEPSVLEVRPNSCREAIKAEVIAHTALMANHLRSQQTDEVKYVQPNSYIFFQKICKIYFQKFDDRFLLCNKTNEMSLTKYSTVLTCDRGKTFDIFGETDHTLLFKDAPVAIWEDKNLESKLDGFQEIGQTLVEVKATCESLTQTLLCAPPRFTGILTNGLVWCLVLQYSEGGRYSYVQTPPIATYSKDEAETITIDEANIEIVTSLLIYHLQIINDILELIEAQNKKFGSASRVVFPENQDDNDRDSRDDDHDDGDRGIGKILKKFSLSSGENKTSKNKAENKKKNSSAKSSGKTKGNALQPLDPNSLLTQENLYRHTARQFSFNL